MELVIVAKSGTKSGRPALLNIHHRVGNCVIE